MTTAPIDPSDAVGGPTAGPALQRTRGRWAELVPIRAQDHEWLRVQELGDQLGVRWRLRGATPSPERWAQGLWQGVLAQHLVVRHDRGEVVGLVCAYDVDLQDGTCSIGFARLGDDRGPAFAEGIMLLVDHLFATWPLRKLCGESAEFNLTTFTSGLDSLLVEEGRRRAHRYAGGRHWDVVLLALWRDRWLEARSRLLPGPDDTTPGDPGGACELADLGGLGDARSFEVVVPA